MVAALTRAPVTAAQTFSFYVGPGDRTLIEACALHADAVTVRSKSGPAVVRTMRTSGFDGAVLFDREGWSKPDERVDAAKWVEEQATAQADRLLTPGRYVPWQQDQSAALGQATEEFEAARRLGATPLLAVDARWVAREATQLARTLAAFDGDVAVILVDPGDPLALSGAVQGLRHLAATVPGLLILRSDHGALGAIAFGARHASLGLIASHRHGTTPDRPGFAKRGDSTARVFSLTYADWFTAATIAGWSLVDPKWGRCGLDCCGGADLSRFLDEDNRSEVNRHNLTALTYLANLVLDAPTEDRRVTFLDFCRTAADRYDLSGHRGPQDPKHQLTGWILS